MRIGVLGTGEVGRAIGGKLAALGHDVMLGSRDPAQKQAAFSDIETLRCGSNEQAAAHGEWIVNALRGESAPDILARCALEDKILIDIANYDSAVDQPIAVPLGELLQEKFPRVRLVKTLNSVSAHLMIDPAGLPRPHSVFIAANDDAAKQAVMELLKTFGWQDIIDLGDLGACRAMEQLIPLWMRLEARFGGPHFNLGVVRA